MHVKCGGRGGGGRIKYSSSFALIFVPEKWADRWSLQAWPCSFRSLILFGPCVEEELVLAPLRTSIQTEGNGCCWDILRANQEGHRSVPLNLTAGEHILTPILNSAAQWDWQEIGWLPKTRIPPRNGSRRRLSAPSDGSQIPPSAANSSQSCLVQLWLLL